MKYKVLVTAEIDIDVLRNMFNDIEFDTAGYIENHEVMDSGDLKKIIAPYNILISEFETVTKDVLDAADNLKFIICCRGGFRSVIDVETCKEKGILVEHNAGRNAGAVAEIVMGYILNWARNISSSDKLVHNRVITSDTRNIPKEYRDSIWGFDNNSPYVALRGRSVSYMTLGIVGYGNVGRKVAEKALAFGMKVMIYDPIDVSISLGENIVRADFKKLLSEADIVTLHCPVTSSNKDMMGKEEFKLMKKDGFFINAARGGLVDENALIWALENGEISGAAIDVTKNEPISDEDPLLNAPNLTITPHIAGASDEVVKKGTEMVIHKLIGFLGMDIVM
ncbi:MAG: hypothetical protein K6B41_01015 [Butyrivibrio sp.]|nr:hypothetical protein [Butyrivibrio sp.]